MSDRLGFGVIKTDKVYSCLDMNIIDKSQFDNEDKIFHILFIGRPLKIIVRDKILFEQFKIEVKKYINLNDLDVSDELNNPRII
jgi:hypothetical protein